MSKKPTIALYWAASCGGCEETVVDLQEKILDVVAAVDIIFWPCAMDFKYSDIESLEDGSIHVTFINGAIRTSEQEHIVKLLRKKSNIVIAFGSCAVMGGIPALANMSSKDEIISYAYKKVPTVDNPNNVLPTPHSSIDGFEVRLPQFYGTVYTVAQIIRVDYFLPGCPPTSKILSDVLSTILSGKLPEKGSVLLSDKSLCTSCDRNSSKPDKLSIDSFVRVHQTKADPSICFLAQSILCMGPCTRDGCQYPCVQGNMPCTGCFGPTPGADQAARMISTLAGIVTAKNDTESEHAFEHIVDPAGTFYRYSMSTSRLIKKPHEDTYE